MRKISYLKNAYKTLQGYDTSTVKRIVEAINNIPKGDIKKLQGNQKQPFYRLRIGKYRAVYYILELETIIVKIDTRGDVYKS